MQNTPIPHQRENIINKVASHDVDASASSNDLLGIISMTIYNELAFIYWIHIPEHTDMYSQGYIGVSIDPSRRLWQHRNDASKDKHCNFHLSQALKKYHSNIIQTIIFEGDESACYSLEEQIRPTENIGWNINKGGERPPSALGRKLSNDHKQKISKGNTGKKHSHTAEAKKKISEFNKGKILSEEHKKKVKKARQFQVFTEETKKKISESNKGKIPGNAKSVKTPLGNFITLTLAAKAHNVSIETIRNWIKKNKEGYIYT